MLTQKDIKKAEKTLRALGMTEATINADAAAILNSATQTVQAILKKRAAMDQKGLQDRPLIVLAGERHDMPAHYLHHIAVLTQLKKVEPATGMTFELPHNTVKRAFKKDLPHKIKNSPATNPYIKKNLAHDFKSAVIHDLAYEQHKYAPYSRDILFRACLKESMAVRFVDVAKISDGQNELHIDIYDSPSRMSIQNCFGRVLDDIATDSEDGMRVRNHHIVAATRDFAATSKARIVFQHCGAEHVAGNYDWDTHKELKETHALRHLFKKAGEHTLSHFLDEYDYRQFIINADRRKRPSDVIETLPLPYRKAEYISPENENTLTSHGKNTALATAHRLSSHGTEEAYVTALLGKMGMAKYGLNTPAYFKERQKHKKTLANTFKRWRQQLG